MNKSLLFSMFAATGMLLATSCSNDELNAVQSSDEAQVSFALGLEGAIGSRAISDGSGADKLVYAVYKVNAKTGATELQNVEGSTNGQFVKTDFKSGDNVSVTLAKGQTYQVAFWAQDGDCKAYNTSDLTNVTVNYTGVNNDELRDAFYKTIEFTVSGNKTIDVVLKRPFAQINVGVYKSDWNAAVASGITIEKSSVVIKDAATSINLLTGAVGDQTTDVPVNYTSELIPREDLKVDLNKNGTIEEDEKYAWLSMSYILVADHDNEKDENGLLGTDRTTLNGLAYTFTPAEGGHAIEFKEGLAGAPVQRNWRTNILGKILTGDIQFNITIDPVYDGDIKYPDAAAQDLELAATFGGTVTLTENVALTAPLNVTADMILNLNGKTMSGALNVAEGISLTVENGTITPIENNGEKLYVNGITSNGNLTLNNVEVTSTRHAVRIESGSAVINGGIYKVSPISKSTLHALHVGDDGTVANVIVKGGTFIGAKGTSADSGAAVNVKAGSTVTIEGGDFSGGKNKTLQVSGTLIITGGTYDQDPAAWVANGYKVQNEGDKYFVTDHYAIVDENGVVDGVKVSEFNGEEPKVFEISNANGLNWASKQNDVDGFKNKTLKINEHIDLSATQCRSIVSNWSPIGTSEKPFEGTFDGNGYTIKNLNIVESEAKEGKAYIGFFGYAKNATIKNVTFENVYINIPCLDIDHSQGHIGAVAGSLEGTSTIENVTVKGDITIYATQDANGASRVAVVAGGNAYGNVTMKNVHVIANEGSSLIANNNTGALAGQLQGKMYFENCSSNIDVTVNKFFAGGLVGIAASDSYFKNCHTSGDVAVVAGREGKANDQYRVGGIAGGWADGKNKVCTLENCSYTGKVSGKNVDGSVADPLDYAGYVGRGYTLANCAGSKVVIDGTEFVQVYDNQYGIYTVNGLTTVTTADELVAALAAGEGVYFLKDITVAASKGGYNKAGILQNKAQTIDGGGHTLTVTGAGATWDCAIYTNGGIIKNITVAGAMRGIFTAGQSSDLKIDNVVFKNVIYTFNSDGKMPANPFGVYVSNSTVNGWTSHSNMHTEVVYTNCSFGEGSGYKFCRPYGKTEFVNCTFCPGYTVDKSQTSDITFTGCTFEE